MATFFKNNDEDHGADRSRRRFGFDDSDDELLDDLERQDTYEERDMRRSQDSHDVYEDDYDDRDTGYDDDFSEEERMPEEHNAPLRGTRYDPDDLDDYKAHRGRYFRHGYDDVEDEEEVEEKENRKSSRRLFAGRRRSNKHDEEEERDYFSGPDLPDDPPKKKAKAPVLKPEDPDYWEQDESEWEHLRPTSKTKKWLWIGGAVIVLLLAFAIHLRYFSPYREAATQSGYVESLEDRGKIFKTIEGVLLPYKNLMDTTRVYDHDFIFTVQDTEVAKILYKAMKDNHPVFVTYKEYSATVPWRGETRIIVTGAEMTDPSKLLPPDRQPQIK